MLKSINRLRADSDFKKVKDKGLLTQGEDFALASLDRRDSKPPRFGFVVSTKISKSAVARNGIKRTLRRGVEGVVSKVKQGFDCVFLVKPITLTKKKEDVVAEVERVMKNANLFT